MRVLRLLLRLYPARLRRADGEAMLEIIETRLRLAGTRTDRLAMAAREAAGLVAGALRERVRPRTPGARVPVSRANLVGGLPQDLRYAARIARRDPGLTAVIVLTIALGIGANAAMFGVVNGVLLQPLPFAQADRLVRLVSGGGTVTKAIHERLRNTMTTLEDLSAYSGWGVTVGGGNDDPEVVGGVLVSTNHFDLLGVRAALGRTFLPDDAASGNDDVAMLSWELWQRRFGGDPGVIGRRVPIDNDQHPSRVVIGVLPAGYRSIEDWQVWMPYRVDPTDARDYTGSWYLQMLGRMTPGADAAAVTSELREQLARLSEDERYGLDDPDRASGAQAAGLLDYLVGPVRPTLLVLLAAVGLVLVIASFNVANLLLARSTVRRRELAVRNAVGAPRGRIIRQLLTESLALSGAGAVLGLAGAGLAIRLLRAGLSGVLPRAEAIAIDGTVLAFTAAVTLATGLLFGSAPALLLLRSGPGTALSAGRDDGLRGGAARLTRAFVAAEVAVACLVVIGAGLMVRTLSSLWSAPAGFDSKGVAVARAIAPSARYPEPVDQRQFWTEAMARVAAAPGVASAGAIHLLPLQDGNWSFPFQYEDQVIEGREALPVANFRVVTPGYFRTLGVPLLRGRDFDARDTAEAPGAVIVNRRMAEELWPGESPIGKRIDIFGSLETHVVGVVGDVRQFRLEMEPLMEMYRPLAQWPLASMVVLTRAERPDAAPASIARALHAIDPAVPVFGEASMQQVMAESLAKTRLAVTLLSAFAALALALGAIGVYGVMSYVVTQRTREIGIRMALGAPGARVRRAVLQSAIRPVLLGVVIGAGGGFAALRVMSSLLYGVAPTDPLTYATAAATIATAGCLAGWLPARRASRIAPLRALRLE